MKKGTKGLDSPVLGGELLPNQVCLPDAQQAKCCDAVVYSQEFIHKAAKGEDRRMAQICLAEGEGVGVFMG